MEDPHLSSAPNRFLSPLANGEVAKEKKLRIRSNDARGAERHRAAGAAPELGPELSPGPGGGRRDRAGLGSRPAPNPPPAAGRRRWPSPPRSVLSRAVLQPCHSRTEPCWAQLQRTEPNRTAPLLADGGSRSHARPGPGTEPPLSAAHRPGLQVRTPPVEPGAPARTPHRPVPHPRGSLRAQPRLCRCPLAPSEPNDRSRPTQRRSRNRAAPRCPLPPPGAVGAAGGVCFILGGRPAARKGKHGSDGSRCGAFALGDKTRPV